MLLNNESGYFYWPSIEDAETRVLTKSFINVKKIYGCNLPSVVRERLEWELEAICEHDFSVIFYAMGEITKRAHEEGYVTSVRGAMASSLVSYLLGITDINPLPPHYRCKKCKHSEFDVGNEYDIGVDLPDKLCPICGEPLAKDGFNLSAEMLLGLDGDKVPDICIAVSHEYSERAEEHLKELFKNDYVIPAKNYEEHGRAQEFFIAPEELLDDIELSEHFLKFGLPCYVTVEMLSVLQSVTGVSVSEIPLDDNVRRLINGDKLITSQDDIFQFLIKKGMSRYDAHKYMRICSLGKLGEARFCGEWEKVAKKHNIEELYIESAKKFRWLTSKANLLVCALAQYRLAWYKTHYPKEFCEVFGRKEMYYE